MDPPSRDSVFITEIRQSAGLRVGESAIQGNPVTKRQGKVLKLDCLVIEASGY
jgi:hypothetical protein